MVLISLIIELEVNSCFEVGENTYVAMELFKEYWILFIHHKNTQNNSVP